MKSSRDIQKVDSVVYLTDYSICFLVNLFHRSHSSLQSPLHYEPLLHFPQGFLNNNIISVYPFSNFITLASNNEYECEYLMPLPSIVAQYLFFVSIFLATLYGNYGVLAVIV